MVVIVFTSSLMPSDTERAYQCGANSVVSKPSDILQLTELVRHFKAWWLDCNRFAFPNEISPLSTL
jgi:CheY-like chemotaxis protein